MTYLLPVAARWFTLSRVVQGASAGAIEVASMSAVAALFSEAQRGRAVSQILAAQLFGIAIGPVAGVVASVRQLGVAFFVTGLVSLVAAVVAFNTNLGDKAYDPTPAAQTAVEPTTGRRPLRGERGRTHDRRLRGLLEPAHALAPRHDPRDPAELDVLLACPGSR